VNGVDDVTEHGAVLGPKSGPRLWLLALYRRQGCGEQIVSFGVGVRHGKVEW
jgi:hypothetical protein